MAVRIPLVFVLVGMLAISIGACNQSESEPAANVAPDAMAPAEGGVVPTEAGAEQPGEAVGMVGSGQATLPPQPEFTEPARPTAADGIQRVVSLDEAREAVPFALAEPQVLPENTTLQIIQLIEPTEGATQPNLPAVRLIYDVDGLGVLVLHQSPATGAPFEGEETTVAGQPGAIGEIPNGFVIVWEADGVRYELRGSGLDQAAVMASAESMAPGGAPE